MHRIILPCFIGLPVRLWVKTRCVPFISLLKGEEVHYLNVFRIPKKFIVSSLPCTTILAPGGQLLSISMFNRKPYLAMPIRYHGPSDASCSAMQAKVTRADFGDVYLEPLHTINDQSWIDVICDWAAPTVTKRWGWNLPIWYNILLWYSYARCTKDVTQGYQKWS